MKNNNSPDIRERLTFSDYCRHFFHVVSNIRPVIWIGIYLAVIPVFALFYDLLPITQFRVPDGAPTGYGSWLYYSIVTITTLGFGDYTPAHIWAQLITAIEVIIGLALMGFFLNAVGSMKSEIDVTSAKERAEASHRRSEHEKLLKTAPFILRNLNVFLSYCYAVTTPHDKRTDGNAQYNPDFTFNDMRDLYKPSGLPIDTTRLPAVVKLLKVLSQTSLMLDSLQNRVDLTIWPDILENSFKFVANSQIFASEDALLEKPRTMFHDSDKMTLEEAELEMHDKIAGWKGDLEFRHESELVPVSELYYLIKDNAALAIKLYQEISALK